MSCNDQLHGAYVNHCFYGSYFEKQRHTPASYESWSRILALQLLQEAEVFYVVWGVALSSARAKHRWLNPAVHLFTVGTPAAL